MPFHPERSVQPEVPTQLVRAFADTFLQRWDCYAMQLANGSYVCIKQPLTLAHVQQHLAGTLTFGTYALNAESQAHWLCLDADDDAAFTALRHLAHQLQSEHIPIYLETSRRGGHLWLFTPPTAGAEIRRFGRQLLRHYHIDLPMEMYPKQDRLSTGVGSLVRLPLGIHRKSGRRYGFITPEGQPLAPSVQDQLMHFVAPQRVSRNWIQSFVHEAVPLPAPTSERHISRQPYSDGTLSERLKGAISVFDFVSRYVELDRRGKGLCPFHDDQVHSFQVNIENNYWSCYAGCGGGSLIDFWMRWRIQQGQDGSFAATVKDLARLLF